MSKHLPNCPHLSPYDGLGTAGINEIMGQRGANCTRTYSVTIETESSDEPADTFLFDSEEFATGYNIGYLTGYYEAIDESDKTYYESAICPFGENRKVILSWKKKKEAWRSHRKG